MSSNRLRTSAPRKFVPVVSQMEARIVPALAYALTNNQLVAFSTDNPAAASPPVVVTGLVAGQNLVGIDYRPADGQLYTLGVSAAGTAQLYTINPTTGAATAVGTTGSFVAANGTTVVPIAGTGFGFDFNPVVDRIRVTTSTGQNFRINPITGAFVDGNFGGAAASVPGLNMDGAINGPTTGATATAYTNNVAGTTITTQYTLSDLTDTLYIQNPPGSGTQTAGIAVTLNGAPLDFTAASGFDISDGINAPASNMPVTSGLGFAVLTVGGTASLYSINLVTGVARNLGPVLGATVANGLALVAATTPAPNPRPVIVSTSGNSVLVRNADGTPQRALDPYTGFGGTVVTAKGDVNGDGVLDIITGTGVGSSHIKVFDGATGAEIRSFFAFGPTFTGGVSVGSVDYDSDGFADIIVGAGPGGGPHVKVFSGKTGLELASFFAYDVAYSGGVDVAGIRVGPGNAAGIVTGSKRGNHVKVFDIKGAELNSFYAFDPAFLGGVSVGSTTIGSRDVLVLGAGINGDNRVRVVDLAGVDISTFKPYGAPFVGGTRVAGTANGKIITGAGVGGATHVKVVDAATGVEEDSFFAFASSLRTGVFVG